MYEEVLRDIEGIATYPVISLVLFSIVFTAVIVWAARADRDRLARLAQLPLDSEAPAPYGHAAASSGKGGRP